MEDLIAGYKRLLQLLDEEQESARGCMDGQYLYAYLAIIEQERDNVENELRLLYNKIY